MRTQAWLLGAAAVPALSFGLSFLHPFGDPRAAALTGRAVLECATIDSALRSVIENKCGSCHSEKARWPVYARLAPASWLLEYDATRARWRWNVSRWNQYGADEQAKLLSALAVRARRMSMPPARYTLQGVLLLDHGWSLIQKPFPPTAIIEQIEKTLASTQTRTSHQG